MGQDTVSGLDRHPGYAVKRLQLAVRVATDAVMASLGLSMAQFAALRVLADSGPMRATDLAERCFITRQSMQDVLRCLRTRALVERFAATSGGHAQMLALTAEGRKVLEEATTKVWAVDDAMVAGLTPPQRAQFVSWLNSCADNLTRPRTAAGRRASGSAGEASLS